MKVYIDGKLYDKENAKVSVFDHSFLYGDGVFEGIRAYAGKVFKFDEHIERLYDSAKACLLSVPIEPEEMKQAILDTMAANNLTDSYIRVVISRGTGDLGLDPRKCPKSTVVIITTTINLYPAEFYETGMPLITASTRRASPAVLDPRIKSCNYLNNILAKTEATRAGCAEAIMLNELGQVAECTADNIFIVWKGVVRTPATWSNILAGITRNTVIELAKEAGIPVEECSMTRYDLYSADEAFLTGTAAEIMPVIAIDQRQIGNGKPGPVTKDLLRRFRKLTGSDSKAARKSSAKGVSNGNADNTQRTRQRPNV